MFRQVLSIAMIVGTLGCVTTPPAPPVWYVLSPVPTTMFPHGDLNSRMSTWEQIKQFPTHEECQNALRDIHNNLHRPLDCVASNDPRLMQF